MRPTKQELETKWWHRLIKVTIWFVSGITALLSVALAYVNLVDSIYFEPILSFEKEYGLINTQSLSYDEIDEGYLQKRIIEKSSPRKNPEVPIIKLNPEDKERWKEKFKEAKLKYASDLELEWLTVKFIAENDNPPRTIKLKKKYDGIADSLIWLLAGPVVFIILNLFYYKIFLYIIYGSPTVKD